MHIHPTRPQLPNPDLTWSVSFFIYGLNIFWRLIAIWPSFHLKEPFSNSRKDNYFPNFFLPRADCSVPNRFSLSSRVPVGREKKENWKLRGALGPVGRKIKENCPFSPTHPPPQDPLCQIYIFVEKCFFLMKTAVSRHLINDFVVWH